MRALAVLWLLAATARAESPFALGGFVHDRHAQRSGEKACAACHAGPPATSPPVKATCVGCHDGKRAFSTEEAACRRCHKPPRQILPLPPLAAPRTFSHRTAEHGLACGSCHALDEKRRPRPPTVGLLPERAPGIAARLVSVRADHSPCAGCHADDFRAASPRTCAVCHVGTEPWRPLQADAPRRVVTEFGVSFSHAAHQVTDCARCHTGITGGPAMRLGPAHDACSSAGCHAEMDACTTCHAQGLLAARDDRRQSEPWSVARRFRHESHPGACAGCHEDAARAADVPSIRPPPKRACAPCHDGAKAFKMTGHGCARCHGQDVSPSSSPTFR